MAGKVALKTMKCPSCGSSLKVENANETIVCVYCENSIVPVFASESAEKKDGFSGFVKVDGIKTPSSALAYLEQFFDEYDWDTFAYSKAMTISEIDDLAKSLRVTSSDDAKTWLVCFKSLYVPFIHKIEGCNKLLLSSIEEYKNNDLDAYSTFDAYKSLALTINASAKDILSSLKKMIAYAEKYGSDNDQLSALNNDYRNAEENSQLMVHDDIKSIPEIVKYTSEKNARIAASFASKGINADEEYRRAVALAGDKKYVEALSIFLSLYGYSNTAEWAEKLDKYFLLSNVLEVAGRLYYFESVEHDTNDSFRLYPSVNGMIGKKPIITDIKKIVTNYADTLYYLDTSNKLIKFDLSNLSKTQLYEHALHEGVIHVYDHRVFMTTVGEYNSDRCELVELNLAGGEVKSLFRLKSFKDFIGNKIVYTVSAKEDHEYKEVTNVFDVDTMSVTALGYGKIKVEGFVGGGAVYTQNEPNNFNKALFFKPLSSDAPSRIIEKNVYQFCRIIGNKLFYYIGNSRNKSLINIDYDGSSRREWPLFVSRILFEQGGWLYFIRKSGYNSVLCKAHMDGSSFRVIAADIDEFVDIKNGYLYYINNDSELVKVRMDGSNLKVLCDDVVTILSVEEDKVIFVSVDDRITVGEYEQKTVKTVKSIYAVDFSGSGKMKLAYDVNHALKYDDNYIYYIASEEQERSNYSDDMEKKEILFRMSVDSYEPQQLMISKFLVPSKGCYIATAVYGSYDCPQVWTLRRFRDTTLASTWYGRLFVRTYYALSPTLVKWFGETNWFRSLWRGRLDRMVTKLQSEGVASTPYEDKEW